jgi:Ala-tRNA(Pro) deacylase
LLIIPDVAVLNNGREYKISAADAGEGALRLPKFDIKLRKSGDCGQIVPLPDAGPIHGRITMQVQEYLNQKKVAFEALVHEPTYDAQRMAQAVHTPGHEVAKTVLLRAGADEAYVVAVLPADEHVDFGKVGRALGCDEVELASEREIAVHCQDCEVGALPPFGSQYGMQTLVDSSLTEDEEIVFEGNTHREAIRMKFEDFRNLEQPLIGSFIRSG